MNREFWIKLNFPDFFDFKITIKKIMAIASWKCAGSQVAKTDYPLFDGQRRTVIVQNFVLATWLAATSFFHRHHLSERFQLHIKKSISFDWTLRAHENVQFITYLFMRYFHWFDKHNPNNTLVAGRGRQRTQVSVVCTPFCHKNRKCRNLIECEKFN
jgi:hypothetical protein